MLASSKSFQGSSVPQIGVLPRLLNIVVSSKHGLRSLIDLLDKGNGLVSCCRYGSLMYLGMIILVVIYIAGSNGAALVLVNLSNFQLSRGTHCEISVVIVDLKVAQRYCLTSVQSRIPNPVHFLLEKAWISSPS